MNRLCKDCRSSRFIGGYYECLRKMKKTVNPVTGHTTESNVKNCSEERGNSKVLREWTILTKPFRCGRKGRYFKPTDN